MMYDSFEEAASHYPPEEEKIYKDSNYHCTICGSLCREEDTPSKPFIKVVCPKCHDIVAVVEKVKGKPPKAPYSG